MKEDFTTLNYIKPGSKYGTEYWAQRLNISVPQLHEAILNTGSLYVEDLKSYLKAKGAFTFSFKKFMNTLLANAGLKKTQTHFNM